MKENFDHPYVSCSVSEFWRRWHISLGAWFREYLYIPLGGNRKGRARTRLNTLIVFLVSGLWHGAAWHFVLWGGLHGACILLGELTLPARRRLRAALRIPEDGALHRTVSRAVTFLILAGAFILFRANAMRDALALLRAVFFDFRLSALAGDALFSYGLDKPDFIAALAALAVLIVCDLLAERGDLLDRLESRPLPLRWTVYLLLIFSILIFGVYGPEYNAAAFIYFAF